MKEFRKIYLTPEIVVKRLYSDVICASDFSQEIEPVLDPVDQDIF